MRRRWRILALVPICGATVLMISGCRSNRDSESFARPSSQAQSVLHAQGTIVSVEEQAHDEQSYDLLPGPRVCFTIDSFAELSSADRSVYEPAERARQAAHGPRCRDTSIDPSAVHIKKDDRVDVYFTLQKDKQISIFRVSTQGVDF